MSAELLPCPFCNGTASLARCGFGTGRVVCLVCGAEGKYCQDHHSAISAWNTRDQAKDAEIAALKEDAERYRWLRDPKRCEALGKEPYVGIEDDDEHPNHWALIGEKADAAIDSARAAGDGEGKR